MSADVQLVVALAVVAAAGGYILRATWRTWFGPAKGCGSGCGKCATPAAEPPPPGRISLPQV